MGAGKGGDDAAPAAAAPDAAQPVVLKMDLHCAGCAHKVKKALKRVPGVESITADVAANRITVAGVAGAAALKARLEAKTKKAVEIISAGSGSKDAGAGEKKADKEGAGEKKGARDASPQEEKEKKQPPEDKKPKQEETVLLRIRLHCDGCADRIRRRIYKIKGVKDVVLDGNAKDEVKVTGTMDIPAMLSYLKEKLNRDVEAVAPAKKDGGKDDKKDKGAADGDKPKGAAGGDGTKDKGKGIEVAAGPSTAAAAAFMAAPPEPSTYHVAPPYGYVAYQQAPPPPASYYSYPYYGNGDGMGYANHGAATYYQHHQPDDGSQHHHNQQQQAYPPYPYRFDMASAPQFFSDENPNACSVM